MSFTSINIQGNIISLEILEKIRSVENFPYQQVSDFGFEKKISLRDQIASAWATAKGQWEIFRNKLEKLPEDDTGFTITRKFWITPFLYELGYDIESAAAEIMNGKSYAINQRDKNRDNYPVLVMGYHEKLDRKPESGKLRMSPHALMQEYLNYTEHLYGLITNGRFLRLLRDSNRLSKLAYCEFDLEKIMEADLYNEFALLYRLLHVSRMPVSQDEVESSVIEYYHQESVDSGSRIRDKLRLAVKEAMIILANGFLKNTQNTGFIDMVRKNEINPNTLYKLILRCMYRIIFLATIEERNLVYPYVHYKDPESGRLSRLKNIYMKYYSIDRLRNLVLSPIYINPGRHDLWQGLLATFRLYEPGMGGVKLGIQPLGGELFGAGSMAEENIDLYALHLNNNRFTEVFGKLSTFRDERGVQTRINYRDLDVEELGSVYEALLELHPYFNTEGPTPYFGFTEGSERKLTGSYYTRHDLVAQLIKTALYPVLEDRLNKVSGKEEKEKTLLDITVCDPAAGSGHFLIAAAKVMGFELARIRSGEENPGEEWVLPATRDVIQYCIYGVDKNPAAVELCRLSLWLVGHNSGKPLTFLKHKIKCGDSLIGIDNLERLTRGIPAGAFKPSTGDDKIIASQCRSQNEKFLKTKQLSLFSQGKKLDEDKHTLAQSYDEVTKIQVNTVEDYSKKEKQFSQYEYNPRLQKNITACNLFTYAFFQPYQKWYEEEFITSETLALFLNSDNSYNKQLEELVKAKAKEFRFFHWQLEFPMVLKKGGFDVLLGNPPWEAMQVEEKQFFLGKDDTIVSAQNKAARESLIEELRSINLQLYIEFKNAKQIQDSINKFVRSSIRFPNSSCGKLNTDALFSELFFILRNKIGRASFIIPTGVLTDKSTNKYFIKIIEEHKLHSFIGFINSKKIFKAVKDYIQFGLLTIAPNCLNPSFMFLLKDPLEINDVRRKFNLSYEDLSLINPNTKTCPIFRTNIDCELTKKIYRNISILENEKKKPNNWLIIFKQGLFNMSSASKHFLSNQQPGYLPVYEAKLFHQFDHRYTTYEGATQSNINEGNLPNFNNHDNPYASVLPMYWIPANIIFDKSTENQFNKTWYFCFRDVTGSNSERTAIFSIVPYAGIGNKSPILIQEKYYKTAYCFLLGNFNSIIFDYITRQKLAGASLNFYIIKQLPILDYEVYELNLAKEIIKICIELVYTSWDIKAFADEIWKEANEDLKQVLQKQWQENKSETGGHEWKIPDWADVYPEIEWERDKGCPLPPFKWDEDRRARLKSELDAWYALLYGLNRDELRYILDPQDVYGKDFPGETFRVLKEKEIRKYGEYRTRRLVLEAYDRLAPEFDMESHLKHLKEVWEKYQVDLSGKKKYKIKEETEPVRKAAEPKPSYGQQSLFGAVKSNEPESEEEDNIIKEGSRVILRHPTSDKEMKVFIGSSSAKLKKTEDDFQVLNCHAPLCQAMKGKRVGDRFEFGGNEWEVVLIR